MKEYIIQSTAPHGRLVDSFNGIAKGELIRCKNCSWHYGTICRRDSTFPWEDDDYCSKAEVDE